MKPIALALSSIVFCSVPQPPATGGLSAAVTDMPVIADMSYADPKTWHGLPVVAAETSVAEELVLPFGARPRPF